MNLPTTHRLPAIVNAALFSLAVMLIAVLALQPARHFEPKIDHALLDGRMAHAFESHYDQSFPARSFGISLWAAIDYLLFGEAQSGVVIGRDGWLFTEEEFSVPADAEQQLQNNIERVIAVRDQLAARGVQLVVAVVPAKSRVYPEHLRRRLPAFREPLYAQAMSRLSAAGVVHADLLPVLSQGKGDGPTFLRTDTHWTPQGAAQAADVVAQSVRGLLPAAALANARFTTVTAPKRKHRGDLLNFLPLEPYFSSLMPPLDEVSPAQTVAEGSQDLLGASQAPRIAVVGTSYSANPDWNFVGNLRQQLSEDLSNYARDGHGPFEPMSDYLQSADFREAPPRVVIWELPERYLPYSKPPELAASQHPA